MNPPILEWEDSWKDDKKPQIVLLVNGKPTTFLCDSATCRATCREIIPDSRKSSPSVLVRSANGGLGHAPESEPVWLRDPGGASCQLSIPLLPDCSVNLLGRDGLLQLGLALVPSRDNNLVVISC